MLLLLSFNLAPVFCNAGEVRVSGITESSRDVTLSMDVAGKIADIRVREGDAVKQGQVILELERQLEELEVRRRKIIWESKAELQSAIEQSVTLKTIYESTLELYESTGSVSKEELSKKELDYKLALAEKMRFEAAEEREQVEYEMARQNLAKRSLRSPIDGEVIELLLDEGENCEPQQPMVRVVNTNRSLFVSNVEERIGRELVKGQKVALDINAGNTVISKTGVVSFVSPVVDQASGLLQIKIEFDNTDGRIRPGVAGYLTVALPEGSAGL